MYHSKYVWIFSSEITQCYWIMKVLWYGEQISQTQYGYYFLEMYIRPSHSILFIFLAHCVSSTLSFYDAFISVF